MISTRLASPTYISPMNIKAINSRRATRATYISAELLVEFARCHGIAAATAVP
jgi:hypothetical protein